MALINCPECEKQISDKAKNCIHCGYPLDSMNSESIPDVIENTDENLAKTEPTITSYENISQTATIANRELNLKDFFKKHKKIIIGCFVGVVAIVLLIILLAKPQPSFEENLVGTWTSSKDPKIGETSISFKYEDKKLSGKISFYDYDKAEWGEASFEVKERTDYTMTLLYDDGTMDIVSYSAKGDTLIFDGYVYTNAGKNIKNTRDGNSIHLINGMEYPVWNNMYFGMSQEEVELILEESIQSRDRHHITADIPSYFADSLKGLNLSRSDVYYSFGDGKLSTIYVRFYINNTDSTGQVAVGDFIDVFISEYGNYDYIGQEEDGKNIYAWGVGNMEVSVSFYDSFPEVSVFFTTHPSYVNDHLQTNN